MPINATEYLRELATRIRKVPVCHGVDGYDIDALREVSMGIAELEKANVAYVDANTGLISENAKLRDALGKAADQLQLVHHDAFKQAGGYGLMNTNGRGFSCFELNQCDAAARAARAVLEGSSS